MKIDVLDHGYAELVTTWGDDSTIIESARVSTDGAFRGWGTTEAPGDERLLKYLWKNKHVSTFEFCGATIDIKCPMFVGAQLIRHWSLHVNQQSARYGALENCDYLPTVERLMTQETKNKQAMGSKTLTDKLANVWLNWLKEDYERCQATYERGLEYGVPKELARLALTNGRYTKIRFSGVLRDWLSVLGQRLDEHAQWETRQFAIAFHQILADNFPRTITLFDESRV